MTEKTRTITIQSKQFTVPVPYAAGHVLTEGEAVALNQTYAENLRNNFAGMMKSAAEDKENPRELTQADLDAYVADYSFGGRVGGYRTASDPIGAEEKALATKAVSAWAAKQNVTQKSLKDSGKWDELVAKAVATGKFRAEAEKIVAQRQEAAKAVESALEGVELAA